MKATGSSDSSLENKPSTHLCLGQRSSSFVGAAGQIGMKKAVLGALLLIINQQQTFIFSHPTLLWENHSKEVHALQGTPRSVTHSTPQQAHKKAEARSWLGRLQQPLKTHFLSLGLSSVPSFLFLPYYYGTKAEIHITGQQKAASHPAVCWFIHVPFHFPSIGHQILHTPILQRCWVRSGKYGLDSE